MQAAAAVLVWCTSSGDSMKSVLFAAALLAAAFVRADAQTTYQGPPHWPTRNTVIADQIGTVGPGSIMMLGDSITEMFWWREFGNKFILDAGQAGAGLDEVVATANAILPIAHPSVVTVMVGVNDCQKGNGADPTTWGAEYTALLASIHAAGAVPVVLTILPVEANPDMPLGANYFDTNCILALNDQIVNIVTAHNEIWVNLNNTFGVPPTYTAMQPGWTMDGVHPYGVAMSTLFYQIEPAIQKALQGAQ